VNFESTTGVLKLDHAENFHGTIAGFSTLDGTQANSDQLDLADINFDSPTLTKTFTNDVLTVNDGTNTAVIHFSGTVGTLVFAADNNEINGVAGTSGIIVYDPPAPNQPTGVTMNDPGPAPTPTSMVMHDPGPAATDNFAFDFRGLGLPPAGDNQLLSNVPQFGQSTSASWQGGWHGAHDEGHDTIGDGHDAFTQTGVLKAHLHAAEFHFV
jgi:hypothetical protein